MPHRQAEAEAQAMMEVKAEGWWCENCEFFESDEDQEQWSDTCESCGCDGSVHVRVEVVTK
jgi:hypothetical protein